MKILTIDDHPLYSESLRNLLSGLDAPAETEVLDAESGQEALEILANATDLDLILLDLRLPDMDGFTFMQTLCDKDDFTPVVVLTASEDPHDAQRAQQAGALGYIPKSFHGPDLLGALQRIMDGEKFFPSDLGTSKALISDSQPTMEAALNLTRRQLQMLNHLADGKTNKEIADDLRISVHTVKSHISTLFNMLDVCNRLQAVAVARSRGWLEK